MKSACLSLLCALTLASAWASTDYSYVGKPYADVYFGHIGDCELRGDGLDPKVLREGREEPAVPNMPLLPGDTIVTGAGRRCEAQFDTGTVVRLDGGTRLRIETILAPALTAKAGLTNLGLEEGRVYVLYRAYDRREVFQVLTPNAAVKLRKSAIATVDRGADGTTGVETARGSVQVLFGPTAAKTSKRKVHAGRRFVVGPDHAGGTESRATAPGDFGTWNRSMTDRFERERQGKAPLPGALRRSPRAVVDFAHRWSTTEGSWLWSDFYGYVWRPNDNDRPTWRPYLDGRWVDIQDELFWVPDEPWGWVPYHLGYWTWLSRHRWVWVPASMFAPAWVKWASSETSVAWRPWDFWDFYASETSTWSSRPRPPQEPPARAIPRQPLSPEPAPPPDRPRPRPPEVLKAGRERLMGLRAGDAELMEAKSVVRGSAVVVPWGELAPRGAERSGAVPAHPGDGPAAPEGRPVGTLVAPESSVAVAPNPDPRSSPEAAAAVKSFPGPPSTDRPVRFRDWNPDVEAARSVGGAIVYSSQDNAVRCESCRVPLFREDRDSDRRSDSSSGDSSGGSASDSRSDSSSGDSGGGSASDSRSDSSSASSSESSSDMREGEGQRDGPDPPRN